LEEGVFEGSSEGIIAVGAFDGLPVEVGTAVGLPVLGVVVGLFFEDLELLEYNFVLLAAFELLVDFDFELLVAFDFELFVDFDFELLVDFDFELLIAFDFELFVSRRRRFPVPAP
jgi:hypothetical protein